MNKWKIFERSSKWAQSRFSSFFRLVTVKHWSWHVVLILPSIFFFCIPDFRPQGTFFNAAAKRIELEKQDWSHFEALSRAYDTFLLLTSPPPPNFFTRVSLWFHSPNLLAVRRNYATCIKRVGLKQNVYLFFVDLLA